MPVLIGLWCFRDRLNCRSTGCPRVVRDTQLDPVADGRGRRLSFEHHVQLLILCGIFWAVAAIAALGDRLAALTGQHWLSSALLLALVGFGAPASLKTLHNNHWGIGRRVAGWRSMCIPTMKS